MPENRLKPFFRNNHAKACMMKERRQRFFAFSLQPSIFRLLALTCLRSRNGFSLFEVLVAVMILAISLVVVLQLFSGGLKVAYLADKYTRAAYLAQGKMEELLLADTLSDATLNGEADGRFMWRAKIQRVPPEEGVYVADDLGLYHITVSVGWREARNLKNVELSSLAIARQAGRPNGR